MSRSILNLSAFVGIALLLSRLSGFLREQVLATQLGLSANTDATIILLTLPDLLVGILLAGGLQAALVPALSLRETESRIRLFQFISLRLAFLSLAAAVIAAFNWEVLLNILAPGQNVAFIASYDIGFLISIFILPIAVIAGLSAAYLNSSGAYIVAPASVVLFNLTLSAYLIVWVGNGDVDFAALGLALFAANVIRLISLGTFMTDAFRSIRKIPLDWEPGLARRFVEGIAASTLIVAVPILYRSLFAQGGEGELATFNFAFRLIEAAWGTLLAPLAIIFLPLLSRSGPRESAVYKRRVGLMLRLGFMASASAAIIMIAFARPLTEIVFGYGAIDERSVRSIAHTLLILSFSIPFFGAFQVFSVSLYAQRKTLPVLLCSLASIIVGLIIYNILLLNSVSPSMAPLLGFVATYGVLAITTGFLCLQDFDLLVSLIYVMKRTVLLATCAAVASMALRMAGWDEILGVEVITAFLVGLIAIAMNRNLLEDMIKERS